MTRTHVPVVASSPRLSLIPQWPLFVLMLALVAAWFPCAMTAEDLRPNAVAFRQMKHGIFITQTYGLTASPAGQTINTVDDFANAFDVPTFADQMAGMGLEYVIFTAWHKSIYCLGPNTALEKWLPGHTTKRDLLGEIADALNARNIKLIIYPHPNDGHDLTAEEQERVGFWDATDNYKVYNDFINEVNNEVCDRYGSKPNVIGFWWDSWWHNSGRPDMPRLHGNTAAKLPGAIILSNMYDARYIDFLAGEGGHFGSLTGMYASKDNQTWYLGGNWWNDNPGTTIGATAQDLYRFIVLTAGCGAPGGMSWALSPLSDGKTWGSNNQPVTVMQTVGTYLTPVRRSICNVLPSHNWVLADRTQWSGAPAYVATRNPVTNVEYVHVVKPPAGRYIDLPLPTESFTAARLLVGKTAVTMTTQASALRLTLPDGAAWDGLDTVIELTTNPTGFPPSVTVTFQSNGGSAVASQSVMSGDIATQPIDPTMAGSTFVRWCSDAGLTTAFDFSTPVSSNITLYAQWAANCTVTFDSTGGSPVSSQSVPSGRTATPPTAPNKAGYTFDTWCSNSELTSTFDFGTAITSNLTLYARWLVNYTVTFNSNGGSTVASQSVATGRTATIPTPAPTKTGQTLVGWYADSNLTNQFDFATTITSNKTLYAKWATANYTVTFNSNGGSAVTSQTVTYNTTATRPTPDPTKSGYQFAGWYGDANLTSPFSFSTPITGATTLYARWSLPLQSSTTTSGGTVVTTFTAGSGTWTVPAGVTSLKLLVVGGGGAGQGYGGGGGGGGYYSNNTYAVTPGSSVDVIVGTGGAGGSMRPDSGLSVAADGQSSGFGTVIAYGGKGGRWDWQPQAGQGGASGGNNQGGAGIAADILNGSYGSGSGAGVKGTAKGANNDTGGAGVSNTITGTSVTYAGGGGALVNGTGGAGGGGNGGNPAVAGTVNTGGGGGAGWAAAGAAGGSGVVIVAYGSGTTTYTVSFNSNGGSSVASQTINSGSTATQPSPAPTKTGYNFIGWYSDSGLTTSYSFSTPVTGNLTLYAKWGAGSYTVTFNSNGGSSVSSQSVPNGSTATQPTPDPTKTNYAFAGWYSDAGLTTSFNFSTQITGNITLYAKWSTVITPLYTTRADGCTVATFSGIGSGSWTVPANVTAVEVLVVGGGGGGQGYGGGGGGGGFCYRTNHPVTAGNSIAVTVGAGGAGSNRSAGAGPYPESSQAPNGNDSTFGTLTSYGGKGGNWTWTSSGAGYGQGGTSGGNNQSGLGLVADQPSNNYGSGSGAGVKGTVGTNAAGGAGLSCAITGSTVWYAGGGGALVNGAGGAGGGGNGSIANGTPAAAAPNNLGGGGGGGLAATGGAGGSGVVIIAYLAGIPSPPADLTASGAYGEMHLTWTAATGAASYTVKRSLVDGGPYTTLATDLTDTSYTDSGLTNGTRYYYVVSAVNLAGESANSAPASAVPSLIPPAAPTSLVATSSSAQVNLAWVVSPGATGYRIKRSLVDGGSYTTIATTGATNTYQNTGLTNGTTYYYVVSAINEAGESGNSTQVSATPMPPAPLRIMCVGDSITAGYTDNPTWLVPFQFGYRSGLYARLVQGGYSFQFVGASAEPWNGVFGTPTNTPSPDLRTINQDHHRGYGGWNTSGILSNISSWLTADNPDIVLLMIGINDLGLHQVVNAETNLNNIVSAIVTQKPNAQLIVAQITPGTESNGYVLQDFISYNNYIRNTLVPSWQAQGKHVTTVDQYANFPLKNGKVDPALFANSINHPSAAAYDRMAQTWFAGIQAADYGSWQNRYPGHNLTDPNGDADGDGQSNQHEYAFGLDPTRGDSVNPVAGTDGLPTAGQFTYTRRSTSGLTYSVWVSTDLTTWTEDRDASQVRSAPADGIETVTVTLSSPPTAQATFVRVQAE